MQEDRWAVAVAYNSSRNPGLHGQENVLEVRYSYETQKGNVIVMFRSDIAAESTITAGPFSNPDSFVKYALTHERNLINRPA